MLKAVTNVTTQLPVAFGPVTIRVIHGWNNQTTDSYIQLFQKNPDSIATPLATGNAPIFKSILAQAQNGFYYDFGKEGVTFSNLVLGISSTETTFTDAGTNKGCDMTIDMDTMYAFDGTETITGDLTTGVDAINPWTDAVGNIADRLLRVDYTNGDAADRYLLLSTDAGVSNIASFIFKAATTTAVLFLPGRTGFQTYTKDAAFVEHYGCRILQSTTPSVAGLTSSATSNIKALWR